LSTTNFRFVISEATKRPSLAKRCGIDEISATFRYTPLFGPYLSTKSGNNIFNPLVVKMPLTVLLSMVVFRSIK
jgi:hypothetical protein